MPARLRQTTEAGGRDERQPAWHVDRRLCELSKKVWSLCVSVCLVTAHRRVATTNTQLHTHSKQIYRSSSLSGLCRATRRKQALKTLLKQKHHTPPASSSKHTRINKSSTQITSLNSSRHPNPPQSPLAAAAGLQHPASGCRASTVTSVMPT